MTKTTCDLLIRNAQVVSMDASRTIYCPGAVAVSGRRIVEVGADAIVSERVQANDDPERDWEKEKILSLIKVMTWQLCSPGPRRGGQVSVMLILQA